ncbi:MAG: MBL fold metallo-hydrolase [Candidatus Delongbacteria bacterium]|nr:MBL fold metallo-hydrolase [Candidatus Delongbacteria bacterium]
MKIAVLSSGSKGNSSFIESNDQAVLIDAGLSTKRLLMKMDEVGADHKIIAGIIVTHDHSDHIKGVGTLARKLKIPVYIHEENYRMKADIFTNCQIKFIEKEFTIGNFTISPIPVSHDGTVNYSYNIQAEGKKISHLTDLGKATSLVRERTKDCDLFVLESNHDPVMLKEGPYPWYLKQRISGIKGHLSNSDASDLIISGQRTNLKNIILAHLSEENNDPVLAYENMVCSITEKDLDINVHIALQNKPLEFIEI